MRSRDDTPATLGELRYGTVATVDHATARCTVEAGDLISGPIRWFEGGAGGTRTWSPPKVGEQVLLICPEGDLAAAIALRGISSDNNPPVGNSDTEIREYADGALISYDPVAHRLECVLPGDGLAHIVAPGGMKLEGDVEIVGNVMVSGTVTAEEDVLAGSISLKDHLHGNVQAGAAKTGAPE